MFLDRGSLMEGDRLYNYERWLHMGGFKCILHFILKNVYNLSFKGFVLCFSTLKR